MSPGRHLVLALCVAACSSAPPAREGPSRVRPLPAADAGTEADAAEDEFLDDNAPLVCEPFDWKNPACKDDPRICLQPGAYCKCPSPPDVENPACWLKMPCPTVPDRRVRACKDKLPCPDVDHPDPSYASCPASPVISRVIKAETVGGATTVVTVGAGAKHDVAVSWRARLLRDDTDEDLPGGEITIVRVDAHTTVGKVQLPLAAVRAHSRVKLERSRP